MKLSSNLWRRGDDVRREEGGNKNLKISAVVHDK